MLMHMICAYKTQILQQLAFLVVCHDLAVGQNIWYPVQTPMSWLKARDFCQRHYVDLTVLSTEEQYYTLLNATADNTVSFWLGLQRQSTSSGWRWVTEEELSYDRWFRRNFEVRCASLEAMLKTDKKLLARYCDESHMFVCQGPVPPQQVTVDSVGSGHVILSWNVSAFMQMTPHSYNVTMCSPKCDTLVYRYTDGSGFMNISISNLTSATDYFMKITAFVVRPDNATRGNMILQSKPTALQVRTDRGDKVLVVILKWLKLVALAPPLWILYRMILNKCKSPFLYELKETDNDASPEELSTEDTIIDLIPERVRGFG